MELDWVWTFAELGKNSNAMFNGLLVGFEMITEQSYQIVLCQINLSGVGGWVAGSVGNKAKLSFS